MTKIQEEQVVRAQMTQRIQDMEGQQAREEAHRVSLEEKHQHAREALEHFRVVAKEQREQDQRQFEQQIQYLQGELRAAKEMVSVKQHELVGSHKDSARLSSELAHARSELHQLEGEARLLHATREQLIVSELKNHQLTERLAQTSARADELFLESQGYAKRLQDATQAGLRLEAELTSTKAVLVSHEQILQKLAVNQSQTAKASGQHKESAENQESLFDSDT